MFKFTAILALALTVASTQASVNLPKVLIVGDSISLGYTSVLRSALQGKFSVTHACGEISGGRCNNGRSDIILNKMKNYYAHGDVDVTTFNIGIHDMSVAPKAANSDLPCSAKPRMVPPTEYSQNLDTIFDFLAKHSRLVIWIDTTTLPARMCAAESLDQYNKIAEEIARKHNFYVLHVDSTGHDKVGIHFTSQGYNNLGTQISRCILTAWAKASNRSCIAPASAKHESQ